MTGMHRSGTSLTASWLEACGLPLALNERVEAGPGNRLGHFEDAELMALQDRLLREHGFGSMGLSVSASHDIGFDGPSSTEAAELVRARHAAFEQWGWKDPRTLFFAEAWLRVVPELRFLVLWRPAVDVVASLLRRGKEATAFVEEIGLAEARRDEYVATFRASTRQAIRLWRDYNRRVLRLKAQVPERVVLVPIEHLLRNAESVRTLLMARFGLALEPVPITEVYVPTMFVPAAGLRSSVIAARVWLARCCAVEDALRAASDVDGSAGRATG